jgi:hypothetical protein
LAMPIPLCRAGQICESDLSNAQAAPPTTPASIEADRDESLGFAVLRVFCGAPRAESMSRRKLLQYGSCFSSAAG